jgi:hypothetical protein
MASIQSALELMDGNAAFDWSNCFTLDENTRQKGEF